MGASTSSQELSSSSSPSPSSTTSISNKIKNDRNEIIKQHTWDVIVICTNHNPDIYANVLFDRQQRRLLSNRTRILVAGLDDQRDGFSIANGFLVAAEYLDTKSFQDCRVLIITFERMKHIFSSGISCLPICEKDSLVTMLDYTIKLLDRSHVGLPCPGVWVCSGDGLFFDLPRLDVGIKQSGVNAFLMKLNPSKYVDDFPQVLFDPITKEIEGFVRSKENGKINIEHLTHLIDPKIIGLVHFNVDICEKLIETFTSSLFHSCSHIGTDSGLDSINLSLFDDILEVLSSNCSMDGYEFDPNNKSSLPIIMRKKLFEELNGKFPLRIVKSKSQTGMETQFIHIKTALDYLDIQISTPERLKSWFHRLGFEFSSMDIPQISQGSEKLEFLTNSRSDSIDSYSSSESSIQTGTRTRTRTRSLFDNYQIFVSHLSQVTNSLLLGQGGVGEHSHLENCKLTGRWKVHDGSICIGLRARNLTVPPGVFLQEKILTNGNSITILHKLTDPLYEPIHKQEGVFMGVSWNQVLNFINIDASELWPSDVEPSLYTARLFPYSAESMKILNLAKYYVFYVLGQLHLSGCYCIHVPPAMHYIARKAYLQSNRLSIADINEMQDIRAEIVDKTMLAFRIDEFKLTSWLLDQQDMLTTSEPIFSRMAKSNYWNIFTTLDLLGSNSRTPLHVIRKTLDTIAYGLITFAKTFDPDANFKPGHAHNKDFSEAFFHAVQFDGPKTTTAMGNIRNIWLNRSRSTDTLFRLARHYQEVSSILSQNRSLLET